MVDVKREAEVPYSPEQMYNLVNSVDKYPDFLPWCKSTEVLSYSEDEMRAKIYMSSGPLRHDFTTINRLQKNKMIEIRLDQGPFRQLEGFWLFESQTNGTKVTFDLTFEFSNKLLSVIIGPIFNKIVHDLIKAFCERAVSVYGTAIKNTG